MKITEYNRLISGKSDKEYMDWFYRNTDHCLELGSIKHPCVKIEGKKAALSDRSIYTLADGQELVPLDKNDAFELNRQMRAMRIYSSLNDHDKISADAYLKLLMKKTEMDNELKEKADISKDNPRCSFCGKTRKKAAMMIAGPNDNYICEECIVICNEILEDHIKNEG